MLGVDFGSVSALVAGIAWGLVALVAPAWASLHVAADALAR